MKVFCEECSANNIFENNAKPTVVEVDVNKIFKKRILVGIINGVKEHDVIDAYKCPEGHLIEKDYVDKVNAVISPEELRGAAEFGAACADMVMSGLATAASAAPERGEG